MTAVASANRVTTETVVNTCVVPMATAMPSLEPASAILAVPEEIVRIVATTADHVMVG